jgi:uncharacterized membrane protein
MTQRESSGKRLGNPGDLGALEQGLGWASIALGLPQTLAPRAFARAIGAPDGPRARLVLRTVCGPRELGAGAGILAGERPWPRKTLAVRVAGDVLDMGLLVLAFRSGPTSRVRLALATAAALGVGTADLLANLRAPEQADGDTPPATRDDHPMIRGKAITIRRPVDEVRSAWERWDGVAPKDTATLTAAPGDQGTELRVDLEHSEERPSGAAVVVDTAKRLTGQAFEQQVADDLRRFKQLVETGEVLRSDASPDGPSAARLRAQRPAQPQSVPSPKES